MLLLLLLAVLLAGQDETPAPNSFQTVLKSTGMLRHRPVFTAMDVSTRSFKINMQAFSSRLLDILIRVKRIQLSKLKVEYRPIAGHYIRAIQEKGSLLQKAVHNGIFFIMKKFFCVNIHSHSILRCPELPSDIQVRRVLQDSALARISHE